MKVMVHCEPARVLEWEEYADRVPERYARSDGLERWEEREISRYEREHAELMSWITAVNGDFQRAAYEALGDRPSPVWQTIVGALMTAMADAARRASGFSEMCVSTMKRATPFGSMRSALEFMTDVAPLLGTGAPAMVVAETAESKEVNKKKVSIALLEHWARVRELRAALLTADATGDAITVTRLSRELELEMRTPRERGPRAWETMLAVGSRSGTSRTKKLDAVHLRLDVLKAFNTAYRAPGCRGYDGLLLQMVFVGETRQLSAKQRVGAERGRRGRGAYQVALVRSTMREAAELAKQWGDPDSIEAIVKRIARFRRHFEDALLERKLIPPARPRRVAASPEPRKVETIVGMPMPTL